MNALIPSYQRTLLITQSNLEIYVVCKPIINHVFRLELNDRNWYYSSSTANRLYRAHNENTIYTHNREMFNPLTYHFASLRNLAIVQIHCPSLTLSLSLLPSRWFIHYIRLQRKHNWFSMFVCMKRSAHCGFGKCIPKSSEDEENFGNLPPSVSHMRCPQMPGECGEVVLRVVSAATHNRIRPPFSVNQNYLRSFA